MEGGRTGRKIVVVLVGVMYCAATGPAFAGAVAVDGTAVGGSTAVPPANNTTAQHVNPDDVAGTSGDTESVRRWLAGRLAERLENSTLHLNQGEYELAQRAVDEQYRERLDQYVDVAGETNGNGEPAAFEQAQESQQRYIEAVRSYRETREEYQRAKKNGNEAKARELARELERRSRTINETGSALNRQYDDLNGVTEDEAAASSQRIRNITANVAAAQKDVRETEFERTQLQVDDGRQRVSFLDPVVVTGRLLAEDGTAVGAQQVTFRVGDRTVRTAVEEDGSFELRYRPTTLPLSADELAIRYLPPNASGYLDSNATVPVTVEQVEPTVALADVPESVRFGDAMAVQGTVRAANRTAAGVPVRVFLDDEQLGTTTTDENGTFAIRAAVPAPVAAGDRTVRASIPLHERALSSANGTSTVSVRKTRTALTVDASQATAETLRASGRLVAADGTPVPNRLVRLRAAGEPVATVRTDENGQYAANVALPPARETGNGTVVVAASFGGEGTNLASGRATATVERAGDEPQSGQSGILETATGAPWWMAGAVVVAALGIALVGRRPLLSDEGRELAVEETGASSTSTESADDDERSSLPTEAVEQALAKNQPDRAVKMAYAAVRVQLSETDGLNRTLTHWEAYAACQEDGLDDDLLAALDRLTAAYEQASFAPGHVSDAEAADAADVMRTFESAATDL